MLAQSFSFLPRIGEKTERRLWTRGVRSWTDYRSSGTRVKGVPIGLKRQHDDVLAIAEESLRRNPGFFARCLRSAEHWRAFGEFGPRAAFVDIETTGGLGGRNDVTIVGVKVGDGPTRLFVRGADYTPEAVGDALAEASMIVTFNGSTFDVPVLAKEGVPIPDVPHFDLRHGLTRLGYAGGLKKVEKQLGVDRGDDLDGITGWDAVRLWHQHELGDEEALPVLIAYNRADVEGMVPLARIAYAGLRRATFEEACAAGRNGRLPVLEGAPPGPAVAPGP